MVFPTDEALQKRMMVVGNLSKSISAEQVSSQVLTPLCRLRVAAGCHDNALQEDCTQSYAKCTICAYVIHV